MELHDFHPAIHDLQKRASSARKTRTIIAVLLFVLSFVIFVIIYINTTSGLAKGMSDFYKTLSDNKVFNNQVSDLNSNLLELTRSFDSAKSPEARNTQKNASEKFESIIKSVDENTKIIESYAKWKDVNLRLRGGNQNIINSVTTSVATIAFSICSILLLIFLVQISVMFMRYYAQLAELYDSQALALSVSQGNTDKAIEFAKEFSPRVISIGKSPDSAYEKVFEIINKSLNRNEK
ncbi:hypothetical protein ACRRQX_004103 [Yersinia enterocolitica]|uniref:hypothetical protein n=1 Tax=Yersinia enterocolitica TaxID=630 RepID=UPI0005E5D194|nr:hypothetical protein [Yersinia enterocolitica]ELW8193688.1 hypothetical protein [Yersinia enterocolitica]ELX2297194.1 hypothetical protein [Yersinia enterocolitica]CNL31114.1 Uncharacterised protein [Yersinia enterocolitica]HDL6679130.1 hypothetical protein [Yersinia enterocolitica]